MMTHVMKKDIIKNNIDNNENKLQTVQTGNPCSQLPRSKLAGHQSSNAASCGVLTLAKCSCQHGTWLIARGNKNMSAVRSYDRHIHNRNIRELNDCELIACKRILRLRRVRRQRVIFSIYGLCAAFCLIFICPIFWNSAKTSASDGFKYYAGITVESGDTLWNLADDYIDYDHYKTKEHYIAEISSINHLDENSTIAAGQLLIVPYYADEYIR